MLIFVAIACVGLLFLIVSGLFGHDHDHDVGADHDHDHDTGADHGADGSHISPSISIFSTKVIATFLLIFGSTGAIAYYSKLGWLGSSLIGFVSGIIIAALMYWILNLMYKQQASSLIPTEEAVNTTGTVEVTISPGQPGKIQLSIKGQSKTYIAYSADKKTHKCGALVKVARTEGSSVYVVASE